MAVKFEHLTDKDYINSLNYKRANYSKDRPTLLDVPIIAIDGEGYNDDKQDHHYDLIAAAGNGWVDYLSEDKELTAQQIFEFLLGLVDKHGKSLFFIYGGSYDFNMWIKRLPDKNLKALALRGKTRWKQYIISWKPKREILITDKLSWECSIVHRGKNKGKHRHTYKRRIHIYDVIGFFQMSFVAALKDWKTVDQATIDHIASMKLLRGSFSEVPKEMILKYCLDECRLLVKLGEDFRAACLRADIKPHHWYGAGALAATLMRQYGVKLYIAEPPEVRLYSLHAYFGGRTEISYQGRLPNGGYQYDINSAYPTAMVNLPCLVHGEWTYRTNSAEDYHKYKWGMWRVKWNTHGKLWNPFPWRSNAGRIYYPDSGMGIYHKVEIDAALRLFDDCEFTIYEGWTFEPKCDHQPFSFIPEKAAYRLRLKAEKEPAAKPLKLGLNSLYGKTAQTLGENPPYQNFFWAGIITATTRAKLLDAIHYCSGTIYSMATDGLISSAEIDELSVGPKLGQWEKTKIVEGFLVKPGIYKWKDNLDEWHYGTRGFTRDEANWEAIEKIWDDGKLYAKWSYPANRFVGLTQALHRGNNWREYFGKWITGTRDLNFHPTIGTRSWDAPVFPWNTPKAGTTKVPSFIRLKVECYCNNKRSFLNSETLSSRYDKAKQEGMKEFLTFLLDEDQP